MSGVVVDVGHGIATCCVVWEGEERPGATSRDPLECTAPVVAEMVHSLLAQCGEDMRTVLRGRVVVTGEDTLQCGCVYCPLREMLDLYAYHIYLFILHRPTEVQYV